MSVTIVVTNYVRPENVNRIIDMLLHQTLKVQIFVWDNSPRQDYDNPRVDWIIRSSINAKCTPRWWMAAQASTDFIIVHDDDLVPSDAGVIARTLSAANKCDPFAVGASGVLLEKDKSYDMCQHFGLQSREITKDTNVDIIKGKYFCAKTDSVRRLEYFDLDAEDDIIVSAMLSKGVPKPHTIPLSLMNSFVELPRGAFEREKRINHAQCRERTRQLYFE